MKYVNFAENQEKWDKGQVTLRDCWRKGDEHRAYGWSACGLGFPASDEQRAAYRAGYDGKPFSATLKGGGA